MKSITVLLTITGLFLASCKPAPIKESVDVQTFNSLMKSGEDVIVLDVRTPEEYADGHIGKAMNIDFDGSEFQSEVSKLDKYKTYLVYCDSGNRSQSATEEMQKQGFLKVYELSGGISEWKSRNMPLSASQE